MSQNPQSIPNRPPATSRRCWTQRRPRRDLRQLLKDWQPLGHRLDESRFVHSVPFLEFQTNSKDASFAPTPISRPLGLLLATQALGTQSRARATIYQLLNSPVNPTPATSPAFNAFTRFVTGAAAGKTLEPRVHSLYQIKARLSLPHFGGFLQGARGTGRHERNLSGRTPLLVPIDTLLSVGWGYCCTNLFF